MKIIHRGRRMGKTHNLILLSAETGSYIVCRSKEDASRIFLQAKDMGKDIPFPLTFQEFLDKRYYGRGIKSIMIDDADQLLQYLSNVYIEAISISGERYIPEYDPGVGRNTNYGQ